MTLRSSPTTSEIARQTVGPGAAAASRPPFTADRCLRIVLSAVISAPPFSSALTAVRLSSSVSVAGRHRHQRGRAAREQHDERVARIGALGNLYRTASCRHTALVRQRMARRDPFELRRQRNRQVRADDDAIANAIACDRRERVGHERRRLADGNHAQRSAVQARRDRRILDGALDQMVWRRGFDGAAGDGQKVLAKVRQRRRLSERSWDRSSSTAPSRR